MKVHSQNKKQYKRRNYFINKELQGRYMFNYFILATIGILLFFAAFCLFSSNTFSITYDTYSLQVGITPKVLFMKILGTQWLFIVIGGGLVIAITLFQTHRIAGPFYRFEKTLDEMIEGNISEKIILRKKDEGKNLAQKINHFNSVLTNNLSAIQNFNSKIGASSLQLKQLLDEPDIKKERHSSILNEIIESQEMIRTLISNYAFPKEKL
ncbi:MAG: methyl-accepting chemotaxis protein [Desulfobacula sp.]|jgi:methyl-accepting chemotaxis protein